MGDEVSVAGFLSARPQPDPEKVGFLGADLRAGSATQRAGRLSVMELSEANWDRSF